MNVRIPISILLFSISPLLGEPTDAIRPGDTLMLVFSAKEDGLDGRYAISREGSLNLPFIGKVAVDGMSPDEAGTVIQKKYLDGQIYTRLSVAVHQDTSRYMSIPNPSGEGAIRVVAPMERKPSGDFFSPEEKKKLFKIDQLDARKTE